MATPIICIVGKKKSGKTTFIEKLLPEFKALGISVGTIKHDAHSFEMDHEGKDSWRHRKAGAATVCVSSPTQIALIKTVSTERTLDQLAEEFFPDRKLIIAEGYFREDYPKVEVHRSDVHERPLCESGNEIDKKLIAMVTDVGVDTNQPTFALDEAKEVAVYIARQHLGWVQNGMWGND